jgi:hypothetical protein
MPISRRRLIASLGLAPALALLPRVAFAKYPDQANPTDCTVCRRR